MTDIVLTSRKNGVTTVTMNRPDALNALSNALRQRLSELFIELKEDDETKVVILTSAGRAFSAGADLKELGRLGMTGDSTTDVSFSPESVIKDFSKPVIAAINGFTITGGFELALSCDILIASTEARFADTHVHMGVVPGRGMTQRLARLIGVSRAKQLSMTGNYLDAEKAERWGLVNDVLAPDDLLPHCQELAEAMCAANPDTLKEVHRLIDFGWERSLGEGLAEELETSTEKNRKTEAETLEKNRIQVQLRGRDQTG